MRMTYELANIPIELIFRDKKLFEFIRMSWSPFKSEKPPSVTIHVNTAKSSRNNKIFVRNDVVFHENVFESRNRFNSGIFDFKQMEGYVCISIIDEKMPSAFVRFMTSLWSLLLLKNDMLLMHAAAIRSGSKGYLFPGPSGSGKTTIVKRSSRECLCDDIVILKIDKSGKSWLIPTMFGREYPAKKREEIPLKAIYFIEKGSNLKAEKISGTEAFYSLMINSLPFMLFERRSPDVFRRLFKLAHSYSSLVDCYSLTSRKEDDVWKAIK